MSKSDGDGIEKDDHIKKYVIVERIDTTKKMKRKWIRHDQRSPFCIILYIFVATIPFSMVSLEMGIE